MEQVSHLDLSSQPKNFKEEVKLTVQLGWPIILSNLSQIALPIIDGVMVGSIHSNQLAAASLVINLVSIPVLLCMGLPMAISPLVSAALGKSDYKSPLEILVNGMLIGGIFSLILAMVFHFGNEIVFRIGQDVEVARIAQDYLVIIGWRLIPMTLFMAISQFAQGLGNTKLVMNLNLSMLPMNILFNYILIFGHWGMPALELTGAGYGTLLSQSIGLLLFMGVIMRSEKFALYRKELSSALRIRFAQIREILKIGIPTGIQFSLESGAFAFSGLMAGWLGAQQQASHQIGIYISSLTYMISMGICAAGSIRVAFYFGKKDWDLVFSVGKSTVLLALLFGLTFSFLLVVGNSFFPTLFTSDFEVIHLAKVVLVMTAIFQLSDSIQATSAGILRGIQDVKIPTYLSLIAYWVIGIPAGYIFAFQLDWGIAGLWMGLILGLSFNAILLTFRFFRKVSQSRKLVNELSILNEF